jgi:DNA-binding transcriptional regulator YhcF (GntR family)
MPEGVFMRLWLSKNSEVPLREQLTTQIMLGITSNDLKPEQKLPSTRELARRYKIHSNTVSAAYRDLAKRGWVEFRKGSGVYVKSFDSKPELDSLFELDQLISTFLRVARDKGFSLTEIQSRIKRWLELQPPDHFLLLEPDTQLRQILAAEIKEATGFNVVEGKWIRGKKIRVPTGAAPVALYSNAEDIYKDLPTGVSCLFLHTRSVIESLKNEKPLPPHALITVVSHWSEFLRWSRNILVAAGIDSDALSFRNAQKRDWLKGLRSSTFVISDLLTANQIPNYCTVRIFHVIADSSLKSLSLYVNQFLS